MTLEAWVKPSVVTGWRTILLMSSGNDLAYSLYANSSSNKPDFQINNGATVYETFGVTKLVLNAWAHIAGTYDGTTLKIYVNGNLVSQKTVTASALITTGKLFIGGNTVWGEYFKGLIDDVRIYSKTLNQSEIQNDMNSPVN